MVDLQVRLLLGLDLTDSVVNTVEVSLKEYILIPMVDDVKDPLSCYSSQRSQHLCHIMVLAILERFPPLQGVSHLVIGTISPVRHEELVLWASWQASSELSHASRDILTCSLSLWRG